MRTAILVTLALLLGSSPAHAAKNADARRGLAALIGRVEARRGIAHRDLALVPLVPTAAPKSGGPLHDTIDVSWAILQPVSRKRLVTLTHPGVGQEGLHLPKLLPSGVVLRRGTHERMTAQPVLLPARRLRMSSLLLPTQAKRAAPDKEVPHTFGGIAPHVLRHAAFAANDPDVQADVLALAAVLIGLDPRSQPIGLAELNAHAGIKKRREAVRAALAGIASAYGGDVQGHVLFIGNRPVECVLAPTADTYRSYVKAAIPGIALSHVIWEELYGRGGPATHKPDWLLLVKEAERIRKALGEPSLKSQRREARDAHAGALWRVRAKVRGGRAADDIGWLLANEQGAPLWLEAWPSSLAGPFPAPAPRPGAPPINEDPYGRDSGSLTIEFLERMLKRLRERRAEMGR
ncbi:MAG: hypothetical protein GY946_31130 [bacterium]|nr:hypothetical protein [bacterium]